MNCFSAESILGGDEEKEEEETAAAARRLDKLFEDIEDIVEGAANIVVVEPAVDATTPEACIVGCAELIVPRAVL